MEFRRGRYGHAAMRGPLPMFVGESTGQVGYRNRSTSVNAPADSMIGFEAF